MKSSRKNFILLIAISFLTGCAAQTPRQVLEEDQSQVQLRSIQSRVFDTADKEKTMRTVIATLQDLDFLVENADLALGSITGTKFSQNVAIKMTVTVRPKSETQMIVRANAQYGLRAVEAPEPYQDFFIALEKSMFLTAHQID